MNHKILAIYDQEEEYGIRLSEYLTKKENHLFQIHVFTKKEALQKFCKKNMITVIMIAEASYYAEADELKSDFRIILSDRGFMNMSGYSTIRKYQSCEKIWKEIIRIVGSDKFACSTDMKRTRMIGIYTPIRRCLQTSFALLLGQILAKKRSVLYLNFEPFAGYSRFQKTGANEDIINLMYFITNAKDKFYEHFQNSLRSVSGLDYIPPAFSFVDLAIITPEQWLQMINMIVSECTYDFIIFDLSDNLQGLFQILEQCERVYTITREDGISLAKINQYERLLSETEYRGIIEKTKHFKFPEFRSIPNEIEQLPFCELAKYIKIIIKEDLDEQLSEM
ncbi:MAG: hypothetical protein PHT21_05600 [Lachnospiraceae bacterium]|nr:hypothetical protein [Lachnospiraceae bacterium]